MKEEYQRLRPNEALSQINDDVISKSGKGKLKIFLGYSPGVGKTYRMLEGARSAKGHNIDVVIAVAETHGRKETEALLEGLEIIPKRIVHYQGLALKEMDLDTLLQRRPQLAIVDEIAHTNAPGSKHDKRYQDVEELLDAGIDVFTTLNIQHVESTIDVVYEITKVKVKETVPDRILELADEIELVDLGPEKLIERLKEGKVYIPQQARIAIERFFNKGNLLALRELSLRYTAKQVDEDIVSYKESHAILTPWPIGSRLLVAISPSSNSENLIHSTHRMAMSFNAEWYAVYVESPQFIKMDDAGQNQLNANIHLAEELGAKVFTITGYNIANEIINFANQKNISLIIAGLSRRSKLEELIKGSITNDLVKKSGPINVLVIGNEEPTKEEIPLTPPLFSEPQPWLPYVLSFACILLTLGLSWVFQFWMQSPALIGMFLLLPVLASTILWGTRVGLFSLILSLFSFSFLFIPPSFSFKIPDFQYLPIFIIFIIIAIVVVTLTKVIRWRAESARRRERFLAALNSFNREMMLCEAFEDILDRATNYIKEVLESHIIILLPDQNSNLELRTKLHLDLTFDDNEKSAATWVYRHALPAGTDTEVLSSLKWHYLPLKINGKTIGVIALTPTAKHIHLTPEQNRLFESFANIIALALNKMS